MSFLENHGEISRYEGNLEVRAAFETGKIRRDLEESLERRARIRVREDLAERLASGLASAMAARRKEEEARARETPEQRRIREAQEAKRWEQEIQKRKEEEERRKLQEEEEIKEARKDAIEKRKEEHKKNRPEYVSQLLSMDLKKAPIRDILCIMGKLGVSSTGLLERSDLIDKLKQCVPELRMKLDNPSSIPVGSTQQLSSVVADPTSREDFSSMDPDVLQRVAQEIRTVDLQRAELPELRSLLSQAQLTVRNYPDRNSMVQALRQVTDAAQPQAGSYFGTVHHSNNLSAGK